MSAIVEPRRQAPSVTETAASADGAIDAAEAVADEGGGAADAAGTSRATVVGSVVLLSTSLLTDRMFLYTAALPALGRAASVRFWATAAEHPDFQRLCRAAGAAPEPFPAVGPFREFPFNYLRRLNEFTWDRRHRLPSRLSMERHVRRGTRPWTTSVLHGPARVIAALGLEASVERNLERLLLTQERSPEARERLRAAPPACLVTTSPFRFEEPGVVATAKRLGIPTLALITSWDNLSTKNRMVFRHDGYLVWSAHMRDELHALYPASRAVPTYVVGAPQFDALYDPRFQRSRAEYCATLGLDAERPIVLCALGAPGFLREVHGAAHLAERLLAGAFGDAQLVIRPHPLFDQEEVLARFAPLAPRVVVQRTAEPGDGLEPFQDEAQIVDWVNTFRHADVVVNLSSTATVDAAACDRPVVNLDYDPAPGGAHHALIRDINHAWPHFAPIAESGGVWLAASPEEVTEAVRTYLARPELHRERRRWIVERVCGFSDGRSGERLAAAILDFAGRAATPR